MPHIKTLTVLGTGVLGSQIAYQAAFHGFAVTAYDIDADALAKADPDWLGQLVSRRVPLADHADAFEPQEDDVKVVLTFD